MITTAVIAMGAMATTGQIKGRTLWAPWGAWTDGIAAQLNSPSSLVLTEGQTFTVTVTGSDTDEYVEVTTNPTPQHSFIGNWQNVKGYADYCPGSNTVSTQYLNGAGANVTIKFNRQARTFGYLPGGYPVVGADSYTIYDSTDPNASSTNPNYVLWDSNEVDVSVNFSISKHP